MLTPKRFYFMRHGQTSFNAQQLIMGHLQIPLNESGRIQALEARQICNSLKIDCVAYSSLIRAIETMQLATSDLTCPKIAHDSLRERHCGEWQGSAKLNNGAEKERGFDYRKM